MLAYAGGDAHAFELLYSRHRGWLHGMLMRQLHTTAVVDDVFQETWFSLIRAAPGYRPSAKFTTWLYLLARQRLVDHWRKLDPETDSMAFNEDDDAAPMPELLIDRGDPAVRTEQRQLGERVAQAVRRLPPLQREALLLAEWRDMSLEDIATITGVPREAVKSRLRYARTKLAQWLADEQ